MERGKGILLGLLTARRLSLGNINFNSEIGESSESGFRRGSDGDAEEKDERESLDSRSINSL
jgi:hypothetical protein